MSTHWTLQQSDGRLVQLSDRQVRVGRDPANDVALQDTQASRFHATLWVQGGILYVRDEGSTNGTFCSDKRIVGSQSLQAGDRLRVGTTTFRVTRSSVPAGRPAQPGSVPVALLIGGGAFVFVLFLFVILLADQGSRSNRPPGPPAVIPSPVASSLSPTATSTPAEARRRALTAAVKISVIDSAGEEQGSGSGSVLTPGGLILTNYHVVEEAFLANGWWLQISIQKDPDTAPLPLFRAESVAYDGELDLIVLRVLALDGGLLSVSPNLSPIPLGDSDRVQIGDDLTIIGFPGVGGETVTLTRGTVAGFHDDGTRTRAWIKTDTEIGPGNSGGIAINQAGELIGIPTWVSAEDRTLGRIGVLRPVNLAKPLISQAQ